MITKLGNLPVGGVPTDFVGLSTDTKPTDVPNASSFYEMDTSDIYLFDAENGTWHKQ